MTDGIQFNEEQGFSPSAQFESKASRFAQTLINWGLVKDEKTANIILVSVSVIFLVASVIIFLNIFGVFSRPNQAPQPFLQGQRVPVRTPTTK